MTRCPAFSGTDPILGTQSAGPQKTSLVGQCLAQAWLSSGLVFCWAALGPTSAGTQNAHFTCLALVRAGPETTTSGSQEGSCRIREVRPPLFPSLLTFWTPQHPLPGPDYPAMFSVRFQKTI